MAKSTCSFRHKNNVCSVPPSRRRRGSLSGFASAAIYLFFFPPDDVPLRPAQREKKSRDRQPQAVANVSRYIRVFVNWLAFSSGTRVASTLYKLSRWPDVSTGRSRAGEHPEAAIAPSSFLLYFRSARLSPHEALHAATKASLLLNAKSCRYLDAGRISYIALFICRSLHLTQIHLI